ncbi:MAG: hypothetical protein HN366_01205 [Deltaproteobacteria bacterium]|jgi:hypothetical protein|nr:hypothetical protein [Deltaproteobacteria bacterium]
MKCPKCNYTSFDYNQVCPKCGNDNAQEQTRLKLSPNKPNPPFFLASLVGMAGSENLEIPDRGAGMGASEGAPGGMDAQDLLIALDDLDSDDARPDSQEPLDPSKDEIVFETNDPKEDSLEPLDPAEDEILFDLEPASEEVEEIPEKAHEVDLFLADEPHSAKTPAEKTDSAEITHTSEELDSPELFLSLDDLPDSDAKTEPSASSGVEEDEILFELEEASETESAPPEKETPDEKGFWNSDEINEQLAAFDLEEATTEKKDASPKDNADGKEDVNLFSDNDIEPLDLELSLDDMEKKPE